MREKMRSIQWRYLFLLLMLLSACAGQQAEPEFTRRGMLEHLVNDVILPLNREFVAQTAVLQTTAHTFQAEPTLANLEALQAEWRTTSNLWQMAQLYQFDRMMALHSQIAKTPTDTEFIEDILARDLAGLDEAFVETVGSTAKGLPAIEYFIFPADGDNEAVLSRLTAEPDRIAYLVGAVDNLQTKARDVEAYWLADGNDYATTFINADGDGESFNSSLNMLTNRLVAVLETTIQEELGRPLGSASGDGPHPELVESALSGNSLAHIQQHVLSVEQAFNGVDGPGLAAYLDYLEADYNGQPLSQVINEQFSVTTAALDAIEPPLATAVSEDPESVQAAYDELRRLLVLIKVDMANQLGVTITSNDSDGD